MGVCWKLGAPDRIRRKTPGWGCGRSKVRATSRALGKVDDRQRANGIDVLSYR